jgi:hypothetical protein
MTQAGADDQTRLAELVEILALRTIDMVSPAAWDHIAAAAKADGCTPAVAHAVQQAAWNRRRELKRTRRSR